MKTSCWKAWYSQLVVPTCWGDEMQGWSVSAIWIAKIQIYGNLIQICVPTSEEKHIPLSNPLDVASYLECIKGWKCAPIWAVSWYQRPALCRVVQFFYLDWLLIWAVEWSRAPCPLKSGIKSLSETESERMEVFNKDKWSYRAHSPTSPPCAKDKWRERTFCYFKIGPPNTRNYWEKNLTPNFTCFTLLG